MAYDRVQAGNLIQNDRAIEILFVNFVQKSERSQPRSCLSHETVPLTQTQCFLLLFFVPTLTLDENLPFQVGAVAL